MAYVYLYKNFILHKIIIYCVGLNLKSKEKERLFLDCFHMCTVQENQFRHFSLIDISEAPGKEFREG